MLRKNVNTIYSMKGGKVMNNIHNKVFTCPKCTNKTLYSINGNEDMVGIGYHDICVCDEMQINQCKSR